MSDTVTNIKINLSKIPKDKIFNGEKGKYIDVQIAEMREPKYGNTHTMYIYDSATKTKTYIGEGKLFTFGGQQQQSAPQQPKEEKTFDDLPW